MTFHDSLDIITVSQVDTGGSSLRKPIISEYSVVTGAGPVVVTSDIGPPLPQGQSRHHWRSAPARMRIWWTRNDVTASLYNWTNWIFSATDTQCGIISRNWFVRVERGAVSAVMELASEMPEEWCWKNKCLQLHRMLVYAATNLLGIITRKKSDSILMRE